MNKALARISSASLDIHDRGVLTFYIHVDYEDGMSQGIGGYALDEYDEKLKQRVGTAYGCEVIRQLLLVLGVNNFSEMVNKDIWVLTEGTGLGIKPLGIQTLRGDGSKSVVFKDILDQFKTKG